MGIRLTGTRLWIIITVLASFLASMGFGQTETKPRYAPRKDKHRNRTDELNQKQGLWKRFNSYGELYRETEYLDDLRHGMQKEYYRFGKVMKETEYQYGIKEGSYTYYYYNGQIKTEGSFIKGKKDGKWIFYFGDGQIRKEGNYVMNLSQGLWKYYNRKGQLISSVTFQGGRDVREIIAEQQKAEAAKKAAQKKIKKGAVKTKSK